MLLHEDHCTLGLSDAGAHVGQLCDAVLSTDLLGTWVRDKGKLTIEQADPQAHQGAGRPVRVPATVASSGPTPAPTSSCSTRPPSRPGPVRRVADFPAGGERLTADQPTGMRHLFVNGRRPARRRRRRGVPGQPAGHAAHAGLIRHGGPLTCRRPAPADRCAALNSRQRVAAGRCGWRRPRAGRPAPPPPAAGSVSCPGGASAPAPAARASARPPPPAPRRLRAAGRTRPARSGGRGCRCGRRGRAPGSARSNGTGSNRHDCRLELVEQGPADDRPRLVEVGAGGHHGGHVLEVSRPLGPAPGRRGACRCAATRTRRRPRRARAAAGRSPRRRACRCAGRSRARCGSSRTTATPPAT